MTILDNIVANKRNELKHLMELTSVRELAKSSFFDRRPVSLSVILSDNDKSGIIAEFKRKSPSKGILNSSSSVEEVITGYTREGASGLSVLTDNRFFGGFADDLFCARQNSLIPILRKDFIIDEYQIIESKSIGADTILLIAAILERKEIDNFSRLARSLGLEVILEIHEENELDKLNEYINIIGVNNRNLKTFEVNTVTSEMLSQKIPGGFLKISESGISSARVMEELRKAGYDGFLVGERFMNTSDPVKAFSDFVKDLKRSHEQS